MSTRRWALLCTPGAPTCSEIRSTFAWGRKVCSTHGVPRGGCAGVLSTKKQCTSMGDLYTRFLFHSKELSGGCNWKREFEANATYYTTVIIILTLIPGMFTQRRQFRLLVSFSHLNSIFLYCALLFIRFLSSR